MKLRVSLCIFFTECHKVCDELLKGYFPLGLVSLGLAVDLYNGKKYETV